MNNEPVAWMYNYENFPDSFVVCRARKSDQDIPLYTHPVKEHFEDEPQAEELHEILQSNAHPAEEQDESFDRTASHMAGEYVSYKAELTDEEMKDLIQEYWGDVHIVDPDGYLHEIAFIRAILKKAQEK